MCNFNGKRAKATRAKLDGLIDAINVIKNAIKNYECE